MAFVTLTIQPMKILDSEGNVPQPLVEIMFKQVELKDVLLNMKNALEGLPDARHLRSSHGRQEPPRRSVKTYVSS